MHTLSIDIETYSDIDIKSGGMYKYVQSPHFEIMLFAYSFDNEEIKILDLANGEMLSEDIISALTDPAVEKRAYNASFEWYCLSKHLKQYLPIEQWVCTMHHGLYCGYPAGLAAVGKAIGLEDEKQKLSTGSALIRRFCVPRKPTKNDTRTRIRPKDEPEKWELFKEYCKQDVRTEMEVKRFFEAHPIPEKEQELWVLDQKINARGCLMDEDLIYGALYCSDYITQELTDKAIAITGLNNPNSTAQMKKWIDDKLGCDIKNLQKATVTELIDSVEDEDVKEVLSIRQELSKSSVKKYDAMRNAICEDKRIRGLLQFYGANRTGRWAGRLVQVQNLPRNRLETLDTARKLVKSKDVEMLKLVYGNIPDTLSQLIRTAFISPTELCVSDFSAIEARVISYLADETWRLDVFNTHGKIYEASASNMFGVPLEKIVKGNPEYALRQKGKVAELALGYQGSKGALETMGALEMGLKEEELPDIVSRWRNSNKKIVKLWYDCEDAAINAVGKGLTRTVSGITFRREGGYLTVELLSGRKLYYPEARLKENKFGRHTVHYMGQDQTSKKWVELSTYGGKLVENIVQAVARDCLAEAMLKADKQGFPIIMHIHDEIVCETGDLDKLNEILGEPIPWALGLPLKGAGFKSPYYMKD